MGQQWALMTEDMLEQLPEREVKLLAEMETIIKNDLAAFLRVGRALSVIKAERLYRSEYVSFEEYAAAKWELGQSRAYQLIDANDVIEKLEHLLPGTSGLSSTIVELLPKNEAQIRPLTKYKDDPEMLEKVWTAAISSAPEGKITAKHVQRTIFEVTGQEVGKKLGTTRKNARQDSTVSAGFLTAFEGLLQEIELAKNSGYKTSDRAAMLQHLDALRHILSEDGTPVIDPLS